MLCYARSSLYYVHSLCRLFLLSGSYIVLQIGIAAVTSLFSVIILHQNRHWASGKPVPAWLSAFVLLRHKNRVDRSIKVINISNSLKCIRLFASLNFLKLKSEDTSNLMAIVKIFNPKTVTSILANTCNNKR